jgi:hypothetical protein
MKFKMLIIMISLLYSRLIIAQSAGTDIATGGLETRNASNTAFVSNIPVGGNANFRFYLVNAGSNTSASIPANTVTVVLSFPEISGGIQPYIYNGPASFSTSLFLWNYDAGEKVLVGTNTAAIGNGDEDIIVVPILGNAIGNATATLNIMQGAGVPNNPSNDVATAPMNVVAPISLPITLSNFNVVVDNCNANLKWTTAHESNLSAFEIEYSPDALLFSKVGTVQPTNNTNGSSYSFAYTQAHSTGYYRLKVIERDATISYSRIVSVQTNCNGKKSIKLFPNPVIVKQLLNVNLSGYDNHTRGELIGISGQLVRSYTLRNGSNAVSVEGLPSGVYTLKVMEKGVQTETIRVTVLQ